MVINYWEMKCNYEWWWINLLKGLKTTHPLYQGEVFHTHNFHFFSPYVSIPPIIFAEALPSVHIKYQTTDTNTLSPEKWKKNYNVLPNVVGSTNQLTNEPAEKKLTSLNYGKFKNHVARAWARARSLVRALTPGPNENSKHAPTSRNMLARCLRSN